MFKALKKRLGKKGFTLIELIVVIAIIAILAVILIPRFTGVTESAIKKSAVSDARNALIALQAMDMQGQPITDATEAVQDYGVNIKDDSITLFDQDDGNFTYTLERNSQDYVVVVEGWILQTVTGTDGVAENINVD